MAKSKVTSIKVPTLPGLGETAERRITRSVMSPLLILCAISCPILGTAIYLTAGHVQEMLTYMLGFVLFATVLFYAYYTIKEPDRLQSEDYRTEMRRIDMIGEPGKNSTLLDLQAEQTPNPAVNSEVGSIADGR